MYWMNRSRPLYALTSRPSVEPALKFAMSGWRNGRSLYSASYVPRLPFWNILGAVVQVEELHDQRELITFQDGTKRDGGKWP